MLLHICCCVQIPLLRLDDEDDEMDVNDQDVHRLIIVTQVRLYLLLGAIDLRYECLTV